MNCRICDSHLLKQIDTSSLPMVFSDGKKAPYIRFMYECTVCKTINKNLADDWNKNVDNNYRDHYRPSTNLDIVKPGAHLNRIIDVCANIDFESQPTFRILDYGMGNGDLSKYLLQNHKSVVIDGFDPYAHDLGAFLKESKKFRFFSDESLLLSSSTLYDYIILLQSFEHISNPRDIINKLRGLLKPKGSILIQIPSPYLNPVDLTVYDHAFHFCQSPQFNNIDQQLFPFLSSSIQVSNGKELLIKLTDVTTLSTAAPQFDYLYKNPFDTLNKFLACCSEICDQTDAVVIFGNSYSSKWLSYVLGRNYELVTSQDFLKDQSLKNKYVLMPFPSYQAHSLSSSLGFHQFISF